MQTLEQIRILRAANERRARHDHADKSWLFPRRRRFDAVGRVLAYCAAGAFGVLVADDLAGYDTPAYMLSVALEAREYLLMTLGGGK